MQIYRPRQKEEPWYENKGMWGGLILGGLGTILGTAIGGPALGGLMGAAAPAVGGGVGASLGGTLGRAAFEEQPKPPPQYAPMSGQDSGLASMMQQPPAPSMAPMGGGEEDRKRLLAQLMQQMSQPSPWEMPGSYV